MTENEHQTEHADEATEAETGQKPPEVEQTAEAETSGPEEAADGAPSTDAASEEAVAEEPVAEAALSDQSADEGGEAVSTPEAAPAAQPEPKRKRKRLPRAQRRPRAKPRREPSGERKPIVRLPKPERERGRRQERRGVVVSSAMDKTIVVQVESLKMHPRYKKVVRRATKFHAHDERNEANVGDVVRIVETRPLSKTKNWRLAEIVEAAR
jgi:small subunit ribosomal protein S17